MLYGEDQGYASGRSKKEAIMRVLSFSSFPSA